MNHKRVQGYIPWHLWASCTPDPWPWTSTRNCMNAGTRTEVLSCRPTRCMRMRMYVCTRALAQKSCHADLHDVCVCVCMYARGHSHRSLVMPTYTMYAYAYVCMYARRHSHRSLVMPTYTLNVCTYVSLYARTLAQQSCHANLHVVCMYVSFAVRVICESFHTLTRHTDTQTHI